MIPLVKCNDGSQKIFLFWNETSFLEILTCVLIWLPTLQYNWSFKRLHIQIVLHTIYKWFLKKLHLAFFFLFFCWILCKHIYFQSHISTAVRVKGINYENNISCHLKNTLIVRSSNHKPHNPKHSKVSTLLLQAHNTLIAGQRVKVYGRGEGVIELLKFLPWGDGSFCSPRRFWPLASGKKSCLIMRANCYPIRKTIGEYR